MDALDAVPLTSHPTFFLGFRRGFGAGFWHQANRLCGW
jgi:hypothetical protein